MEDTLSILQKIDYETNRTTPPEGFPKFPDLPGERYTDTTFYELEKKQLWRKCWLFAGHEDEIPEPGSFKKWEMAGQPVVIVRTKTDGIAAPR